MEEILAMPGGGDLKNKILVVLKSNCPAIFTYMVHFSAFVFWAIVTEYCMSNTLRMSNNYVIQHKNPVPNHTQIMDQLCNLYRTAFRLICKMLSAWASQISNIEISKYALKKLTFLTGSIIIIIYFIWAYYYLPQLVRIFIFIEARVPNQYLFINWGLICNSIPWQ